METVYETPKQKTGRMLRLPAHWSLIQRVKAQDLPDGRKGIDALLHHDYMGSAEFEYGALPKVWKAFRTLGKAKRLKVAEYAITPVQTPRTKTVRVWAVVDDEADDDTLKLMLSKLSEAKVDFYLKESTYFDEQFKLEGASQYRLDWNGWLVLDDVFPVFFTVDRKLANRIVTELQTRKGVKAEELTMFDPVEFDHAGQKHKGQIVGIYEGHAAIRCESPNLAGKQRIAYTEIYSPS